MKGPRFRRSVVSLHGTRSRYAGAVGSGFSEAVAEA